MARKKNLSKALVKKIQLNCDISDARDHGIYSICILILRLRGLYKWENGVEPWDEPQPSTILDWIDKRENYWETILEKEFCSLDINGATFDPFDVCGINNLLRADGHYYGAGYGRSMKSIFFLAEILEEQRVNGCRVLILGTEKARELAGPFALKQDDLIIIRKEQLRFFLWDHLQEILPSARKVMQRVLSKYLTCDKSSRLSNASLKHNLEAIVNQELPVFIHHEIGEMQKTPLSDGVLQSIIHDFPDSLIEFFCRSVKDILADTHSQGMLQFIINEKREMSLGFYISFLSGIRRTLFPEIIEATESFLIHGENGWQEIEQARQAGWDNSNRKAETIVEIVNSSDGKKEIAQRMEKELFEPLGLSMEPAHLE